jgi:Fe-S-cluster containining protein
MLDFSKTFKKYEALVAEVDAVFRKMQETFPEEVRCANQCADCCHAVFDLSLIEAIYLNYHFYQELPRESQDQVLERTESADRKFFMLMERLRRMHLREGKTQEDVLLKLSEEQLRCPLLNQRDLCDLYPFRPITCRIYGIPTAIGGNARSCGKAGFLQGKSYPTLHLDRINQRLMDLSKEMIEEADLDKKGLFFRLAPVSTALLSTYDQAYFESD